MFILNEFVLFASLEATFELYIKLLLTPWILKTLGFLLFIGAIMALIEKSGGVGGFIHYALHKKALVKSQRSALMLSYIIGVVVFIETSITALVAGAVGKPFCKKYQIPHAKLAFVCDSTSAPIGSLVIFNGYGALLLGLITTQISQGSISGEAIDILIDSVLYNFYAMSALVVTFLYILYGFDIGPMKKLSYQDSVTNDIELKEGNMYLMLLPIFSMLVLIFVFLYITGDGDILKGSGSSSIFYTMITTFIVMFLYYIPAKVMSVKEFTHSSFLGAKNIFNVSLILIFAFSIGEVTTQLETGKYLATLASENLNVVFLAAMVFLLSSVISFSTGTSWGTFSIMIPIAIPMAVGMDANIALVIGAVISGGIFGDHCSPISDTTIISSMAADCDVIEHVKTQIPYALISGTIALVLFTLMAFL